MEDERPEIIILENHCQRKLNWRLVEIWIMQSSVRRSVMISDDYNHFNLLIKCFSFALNVCIF